jgi:nitrogen fixation/metabolism regulation signal transduction histidine kinase
VVQGALVKIAANPVFLRATVVFFFAAIAFLLAMIFIRLLRKKLQEGSELEDSKPPSLETLPLHVYSTVIQQLKQQKHELEIQSQAEQHRARTTETFSQAVLSNLSCGVLVFGTNGLVKTSNSSAKQILGFASTTGMGADDIFRGAVVTSSRASAPGVFPDGTMEESICLSDEVDAVMREGSKTRQAEAEYETPTGEKRHLAVTVSPVPTEDGGLLGVACLITDLSEREQIRRQQELQGEISAEMALQLRTSLTTIAGYAQQLANNRDAELAQQLAADIAHEAADLDRRIGGFLTEKRAHGAVAGTDASR